LRQKNEANKKEKISLTILPNPHFSLRIPKKKGTNKETNKNRNRKRKIKRIRRESQRYGAE